MLQPVNISTTVKNLGTYTQKDIFPDIVDDKDIVSFEERITVKAVIFDDEQNVALVGTAANSFYLLPGGGVEGAELPEDAIVRECLEEAGCVVADVTVVAMTDDYRTRDRKHCISYCYTVKLVGQKGELQLTDEEENNGHHVKWVPIDEAVRILEAECDQLRRGEVTFYNTGFNILRDCLFLQEVQSNL